MNKKGFMEAIMQYVILTFILAFIVIFLIIIVNQFNDGIQNVNSTMVPDEIKNISSDYNDSVNGFDIGFIALLLGFIILSVVLARMLTEVKPWYVVIGVFALIAVGFLGMIMENVWSGFNANSNISPVTGDLLFLPFIMDNFIALLIVYVGIVVVARMTRDEGGIN